MTNMQVSEINIFAREKTATVYVHLRVLCWEKVYEHLATTDKVPPRVLQLA